MEQEGSLSRSHDSPPIVLVLRQINPVHAPFRPIRYRSVLILSFHLYLGRPSGSLPSLFPTKTPQASLFRLIVPHAMPTSFFLVFHPNNGKQN